MRWKIKSITSEEKNDELITTTNKVFTITVGDIAGVARTASGALKALGANIGNFIKTINDPNNPASLMSAAQVATVNALNSLIQPMAVVAQGMEIYRKVMKIASVVSPILQMVARASGVWCSPGNAVDIADIIGGTIIEVLSSLAMSAFLMLKEWIWNYEFELWSTNVTNISKITKIVKKLSDNLNKETISWLEETGSKADPEEVNRIMSDDKYKETTITYPSENIDLENAEDNFNKFGELSTWNKSSYYKTIKKIDNKNYPRMLRGSNNDCGIQYSDDDGKTWKNTKQVTGSFCCFAKLVTEEEDNYKITYFAASAPYIKSVVKTTDEKFSTIESNIQNIDKYNKPYYDEQKRQLTKRQKDIKKITDVYEPDIETTIKATGLYKSDDDGITWTQVENMKEGYYGKLIEFCKKKDYGFTLVAASYGEEEYKGIYWTRDGDNWTRSKVNVINDDNSKSLEESEVKWPNISIIDDNFIVRAYPEPIQVSTTEKAIPFIRREDKEPESFNQSFTMDVGITNVIIPEWISMFKEISNIVHKVTEDNISNLLNEAETAEKAANMLILCSEKLWKRISHSLSEEVLIGDVSWFSIAQITTIGPKPVIGDNIGRNLPIGRTIVSQMEVEIRS